jgi:hypothetical protein
MRKPTQLGCQRDPIGGNGVRSKVPVSKDGVGWSGVLTRGALYVAGKPIHLGEIRHKGVCHPGQHAPIVDRAMWDKVAQLLRGHSTGCGARSASTKFWRLEEWLRPLQQRRTIHIPVAGEGRARCA